MEGILRVGTVTKTDLVKRLVRVQFADVGILSDWLKVIKSPPFIPKKDVPQKTEIANLHNHDVIIEPWFPDVGDVVLCVYNPGFNEDGYVLGAL